MADNFVANPGVGGDTFRADDLSGVKVPGSKIVLGADNVDEGYVGSTNPMPALSKVQNATGTTINPATSGDITNVVNAILSTLSVALAGAIPSGSATIGAVLNSMVAPTTGTITANGQMVTCALSGAGGGVIAYSGTFSGINASFQASYDGGTNYTNHIVANVAGTVPSAGLSGVSTGVAAFIFYCPGATHFRINCTAFTSGTMNVTINPLSVSHPGFIEGRVSGFDASNAAATVNPFQIAIRASSSDPAVNSTNTLVVPLGSQLGKPVVLPFAIANNTWTYAAAAGGLVTTAGITVKAAGAAGIRNYITHIDAVNSHATIGTDIQIRDGASGTVLWRGWAQPAGGGVSADFNPPLRGTAVTLVEIAEGTATGTTGVYCNLSGYQAGE